MSRPSSPSVEPWRARSAVRDAHLHPWRRFWLVLLFGLLAFITWQALRQQPTHPAMHAPDKLLHALAFAALAVPARLLLEARGAIAASAWAAIALLAYGAAIEGVQATLPYRSAEWGDLLADAVGVTLGLSLAWGLRRWAVGAPRAVRR